MQHFWGGATVYTLWIASKADIVECIVKDVMGQQTELVFILVFALNCFNSQWQADNSWIIGKSSWAVAIAANKRVAKLVGTKPTAQLVVAFTVAYHKCNRNLQCDGWVFYAVNVETVDKSSSFLTGDKVGKNGRKDPMVVLYCCPLY
jgi:hypothetical protein